MANSPDVDAVAEFIRGATGIPESIPIDSSTRIYGDLGIYGDDIHELIDAAEQYFGVDLDYRNGDAWDVLDLADDEQLVPGEGEDSLSVRRIIRRITGRPEPWRDMTVGEFWDVLRRAPRR